MNDSERIAQAWLLRATDATAALARSSEMLADAVMDYQRQDLIRLHATRAVALATLNRFTEAIEAARSAEEHRHSHDEPDIEIDFELRRIHNRKALLDRRETEALKLTLTNLELAAHSENEELLALGHSDVAAAYGIAGNLRKALEHLQQSLQRTPESSHARYGPLLNNLGNVYMSLRREEEAMACFVQAREAFSKVDNRFQMAVTLSNEGRALAQLGQVDRAIKFQEEALEFFEAGGFGHLVAATLYKLADVQARAGDTGSAERTYGKALARIAEGNADGHEGDVRVAYGEFLMNQGRPAEAAEQFELGLEIVRAGSAQARVVALLEHVASARQAAGDTRGAMSALKELLVLRDDMDLDPAGASTQSGIIELEMALERELGFVQATASALVEANKRLAVQSRELSKLATTDYLTGLYNRRHFSQKLETAVSGSREADGIFSVIFLDVDSFKAINDTYGHETGDLVLQELATVFESKVRETDVVARWGGEEFAVLLPGVGSETASKVADKLRITVEEHTWQRVSEKLRVTVSAGVISSADHPDVNADDVMRLADELLYKAKFAGRNRIVHATEPQSGESRA